MSAFMETFRARMAEVKRKAEAETEEPSGYGGVIPPELTKVTSRENTSLDLKLNAISLTVPELPDKFNDIPEIRFRLAVANTDDFPDDSWRGRPALQLKVLSNLEIITYGRELLRSLTAGVSMQDIGKIFLLAWNLRKPGFGATERLITTPDALAGLRDRTLSLLGTEVIEIVGVGVEPLATAKEIELVKAYTYIAASMLKLFTRSPENYDKSWTHIMTGYTRFYGVSFPISNITPSLGAIKNIHDQFNIYELFRSSLYRILYNINQSGKISSIQEYLYDIPMSHTGMHAVPIAYKLCIAMNCAPKDLLRVLDARRFKPQIEGLISAFKLAKSSKPEHKRQMWKYGRIFDSTFLATLQTKSCPKFVYIMACMLKRENAISAQGILEIRQLEEVSPEEKEKLWKGSKVLIDTLKKEIRIEIK